jgi:hypothetical protein
LALRYHYRTDIVEPGFASVLPTPFAVQDDDLVICVENTFAPHIAVRRLHVFPKQEGVRVARSLFAREGFFLPNEPRAAWYALNYFDDTEMNEAIRSMSNGNVTDMLNLVDEPYSFNGTARDVMGNTLEVGDVVTYLDISNLELGRVDSFDLKTETVRVSGVTEDNATSQNVAMNEVCFIQVSEGRRAAIQSMSIKEIREFYSAPSGRF